MKTNRSTGYKLPLFCAAFVLFSLGSICCGVALAAIDHDSNYDVDFDNVWKMSEIWLSRGNADERIVGNINLDELRRMNDLRQLAEDSNDPNVTTIVSDVNVTPEGGIFELPGGLLIDIPAGMVIEEEDISLQIRMLGADEVEPYLDIGETKKGFMGGFEIAYDGLEFDLPVSISFPVEPLKDPNNLPYLFVLNVDNGTFIPNMQKQPPPQEKGAYALLEADASAGDYIFDGRYYTAELILSALPQHPVLRAYVLTELYGILGHKDCQIDPCRCQGGWDISEGAYDVVSSEGCSNYDVSGHVTYYDCPGQPTETWGFSEGSIQITYRMIPDKRSILCDGSITMVVELFDIDDMPLEDQQVQVTSSRPDLLQVTSSENNRFNLQRVGHHVGVAEVVISAACKTTRTIPIRIGCEIPNLAGLWRVSGSETWWGCKDPEDDGVYPGFFTVEFEAQAQQSQYSAKFGGSYEFSEFTDDYTLYYEETYNGTIAVDCEVTDKCAYKVSGDTSYTEMYFFPKSEPDDPPYIIEGIDTFSGKYELGIITLTTLGFDTDGDTCQTAGTVTLRR